MGLTKVTYSMIEGALVNVLDFGAIGDGVTDDTVAIQTAIQSAIDSNASGIFVPATENGYRTTAPINITTGVMICGSGTNPYGTNGPYTSRGAGSWFFFDHSGAGFNCANSNGSNFVATVRFEKIGTYRNHTNTVTTGWTPTVFGFDFVCNNCDMIIEDVMMLNAYRGINVVNGNAGRLTVNNLRGQWFSVGINVDVAYDTVRLNNIHMWPFWSNDSNVTNWQQVNTICVAFNRCDNPQISNMFSIYTNVALGIYQNAQGTTSKIHVTNMDNDFTLNGILVDSSTTGVTGQFVNVTNFGPATPNANAYNVHILGDYSKLEFVNLEGRSLSRGLIQVQGFGNIVNITSPRVATWDTLSGSYAAFTCLTNNVINITNRCVFDGTGTVQYVATGTIRIPQFVTSGQASIGASSTSVTVAHGLPLKPSLQQIQIWMNSGIGFGKNVWTQNVTATTFDILCDTAPGSVIYISWRAAIE